ncbi:hypothetical protein T4B_662 [Trichinella pseudospiralis]|uniref:Uncharacterized protein n=1 Tax=Trichinella pseudospiralis TaxID=6337 RepID=A0A0V1DXB4_TRIPS|nr:hypothetical protein T4A_8540 [Trichinella pseudospiralis]KRZ20111.1 hypothetical protein T4B_662 [Trichinella pseudospiralis]KRZ34047.1 hypothetical protein T4C_7592 [Trichinella pseudospiralis]
MEEDRDSVQVHGSVELVSLKNRNKKCVEKKKSNSSSAHPGIACMDMDVNVDARLVSTEHQGKVVVPCRSAKKMQQTITNGSGGVEVTVMIVVRAFVENGHCPTVLPSAAIQHSRRYENSYTVGWD